MDRAKYMTTGEVASIMNVTKNTLFHYDKIGLFSPEIKKDNDYRYYSSQQLDLLDAILWLRELDMPLEEIKQFIRNRTPEKLLKLFEVEEELAAQQLRKLKDRQNWMLEKKAKVEGVLGLDLSGIYRRSFPRRYFVINDVQGDSAQDFAKSITNLMESYSKYNDSICYELGYLQQEKDIRAGIYDNCRNVALFMGKKPKGIKSYMFDEGEYLVAYHLGAWESAGEAYERLLQYAEDNSLELEGCFAEKSVIDHLAAENECDFVTEISVKLKDKVRAVVFDLDGTLLDCSKQIQEPVKKALHKLASEKMMVIIATGRPLSALPREVMELEGVRYFITSNGALIYDRMKKEVILQTSISRSLREKIFEACEDEEITFEAFIGGQAYIQGQFLKEMEQWNISRQSAGYLRSTRKAVDDIRRLVLRSEKVEGIGIRLKSCTQKERIMAELESISGLYVTSSVDNLVEAADMSTNKCKALEALLDKTGISLKDTAAFGDADNDTELLEAAGIGIAMGNGTEKCKAAADFITRANDDQGIVYGLDTILGLL